VDQSDFDPRQPFTRAQGLAAGLTRRQLAGPGFRQLLHGIHVAATVPWTPELRTAAALVPFGDGAFASHCSAARVHDAPVPGCPSEHVTVGAPAERRTRAGIVCHVREDAVVRQVRGIAVTDLAELFVELAAELDLVDLVVVGDWMLRRKGMTTGRLAAAVRRSGGRVGRHARLALGYVRPRVDSPMETRLRMLLVLAGVPEPRINLEVRASDGELLRRYDLCWPEVKVIVEYNGRVHDEDREQRSKDIDRSDAVADDGWRLLVVIADGVYGHPGRTVDRVWRVLRERGMEGLPQRPSDAWRPYFPGRAG
jgi:hypothetical protein